MDSYLCEAQRHVLEAHAERLTAELSEGSPAWKDEFHFRGSHVSVEDIVAGRAPRPRVLDLFGGGGAIGLEAQRLGCEAYSLDINPVAHIIELSTLVYPQRYGRADSTAWGKAGPKGKTGKSTWGGLADEVRYWGEWVLREVRREIGDLYPLIPDPEQRGKKRGAAQQVMWTDSVQPDVPDGYLVPLAYLWTRTVRCKKPGCGARVPLLRQTWLCRSAGRHIALKVVSPHGQKEVRFIVVKGEDAEDLGFDPSDFSSGGNATCPFCGTVADDEYVKDQGFSPGYGQQLMAVVCQRPDEQGKLYLACGDVPPQAYPVLGLEQRLDEIASKYGITVPDEPLEANPRSFDVQHFGFKKWRHVFSPRQLIAMTTFAGVIRAAQSKMTREGFDDAHMRAVATCLSMNLGRLADYCTTFATWQPEFIAHTFDEAGMPMIMDFAEGNPLVDTSGSWLSGLGYVCDAIGNFAEVNTVGNVARGSALATGWADEMFDAIVTDPPYYDSRSYSNLSDHFYVWHKRSIGNLYQEHFTADLTPKKKEAIAAPYRHGGSREEADRAYEEMMQDAFSECHRLLKPGKPLVCVYAHKTTAGWSTLINALMGAGFTVVEAWPVNMERKVRKNAQNTAALASSIFLVARKRPVGAGTGSYETQVQPNLEEIVRERVGSLWDSGITGGDLVIAAVGAGLRAFTHFERVEFDNGEEVPAEKFLNEVEAVVLDTLMSKIFGVSGNGVGRVDPRSRFYVLWRYLYKTSEVEAGEAIVFTYGQPVELDGPLGLTAGRNPMLSKKKGKYRLRDFAERGDRDDLGLPEETSQAPLIDVLHRALWLMENRPRGLAEFLNEASPNREQLRLVAAALAGPGLSGGSDKDSQRLLATTSAEQAALGKMLANWRTLIPDSLFDTGKR